MYEELVKRLKNAAELLSQDIWAAGLFAEAADAMQDLENKLNMYRQGKIHRPNNDLPTSAKCGGD